MLKLAQSEFPWFGGLFSRLESQLASETLPRDPAHDLSHILRVASWAHRLAEAEGASTGICLAAALLHDLVHLPKNDPQARSASQLSAELAMHWIADIDALAPHREAIGHAIVAHSWSSGLPAETLEARIVQDADRLDALGAIGIARTFATGASLGSRLWHSGDPWGTARPFNDRAFSLDHFPVKLLRLGSQFHTALAREEAKRREATLQTFLDALRQELDI